MRQKQRTLLRILDSHKTAKIRTRKDHATELLKKGEVQQPEVDQKQCVNDAQHLPVWCIFTQLF